MRNTPNRAPMRTIVAEVVGRRGVALELLACGHVQDQVQDVIGPTHAKRRRCRTCERVAWRVATAATSDWRARVQLGADGPCKLCGGTGLHLGTCTMIVAEHLEQSPAIRCQGCDGKLQHRGLPKPGLVNTVPEPTAWLCTNAACLTADLLLCPACEVAMHVTARDVVVQDRRLGAVKIGTTWACRNKRCELLGTLNQATRMATKGTT